MNWEPLFYVAHSRWGTRNSAGLIEVARLLLAHGASPNASYAWSDNAAEQVSVLWAASCQARHLELARVLLEAGAKPDDGESVYHAAENGDTAMLDLLAAHGAQADGGDGNKRWQNTPLYFILGHYAGLGHDAAVRRGVAWLLAHGADPNRVCYPEKSAETPLHAAARHWDVPMIELLAQHGANLRAKRKDGRTAYVLAAMHGRTDIVAWLRDHDGDSDLSPAERFLAACMRGDRAKVDAMLRGEPRFAELTRDPGAKKLFFEVAGRTDTAALETMLACGFDPAATDDLGATPLHWAAFTGNLAGAKVLIAHGAPLDVRDRTHKSLLLGWADYAAANLPHPQGDYVGVVRALLAAGAALPTPEALESWASEELIALVLEAARQRSA